MDISFDGQVVVVTGAAQGLGYTIAQGFLEAGATVFITDLNAEKLDSAAKSLSGMPGRVIPYAVDSADPQALTGLKGEIEAKVDGRLDVLINNAGGWRYGRLHEISQQDWLWTFRVNVETMFFTTQALMPLMIKRQYGRIVNVSSADAYRPKPNIPHYAAAKAASVSLTKSLAAELGPSKILVNGVSPGNMLTEAIIAKLDTLGDRLKQIPTGRFSEPAEVAALIMFLASKANTTLAGETIIANGGELMI